MTNRLDDSYAMLWLALGDIANAVNDAGQAAQDVNDAGGDSSEVLPALRQIRAIVSPLLEGVTPAE